MQNLAVLKWIERSLLAVGLALGGWSVAALIEAHYYKELPPPPIKVTVDSIRELPARGDWVARMEAPTVRLSATILEGTDDATLSRAAGHIEDTPLPGEHGNLGIAGHRDTTFRAVRLLKVGDPLLVTTRDRQFEYRISKTTIVNPEDVWVLDASDHDTLTLVTCYPFEFIGHAPKRYIISADLVGPGGDGADGPDDSQSPSGGPAASGESGGTDRSQ